MTTRKNGCGGLIGLLEKSFVLWKISLFSGASLFHSPNHSLEAPPLEAYLRHDQEATCPEMTRPNTIRKSRFHKLFYILNFEIIKYMGPYFSRPNYFIFIEEIVLYLLRVHRFVPFFKLRFVYLNYQSRKMDRKRFMLVASYLTDSLVRTEEVMSHCNFFLSKRIPTESLLILIGSELEENQPQ